MIMAEIDVEFVDLVTEFLESSRDLREAAEMTHDDPIKQDMIKGVIDDFLEVTRRSEAIRLLVETSYSENREYILSELKDITKINKSISASIRKKLAPLTWN
jgi:hypothetical protein